MGTKKTNAQRARLGAGGTEKYAAREILQKYPTKRNIAAALEALRLPEHDADLVWDAIGYLQKSKLNGWRTSGGAISHAIEYLNRLGFMVGGAP